ncbi:hypothetical protein LSH36_193g12117 [Paralvinella palmiformis]|uniref:Uncharacterized protein n=1 Tax=Paralvinella palmiformis TaxID=53620 RepID=A0AAD9N5D1_9ANNE|nr:hypothetical protein LSH36_193g12117 [Paralvinella palmiformis]
MGVHFTRSRLRSLCTVNMSARKISAGLTNAVLSSLDRFMDTHRIGSNQQRSLDGMRKDNLYTKRALVVKHNLKKLKHKLLVEHFMSGEKAKKRSWI